MARLFIETSDFRYTLNLDFAVTSVWWTLYKRKVRAFELQINKLSGAEGQSRYLTVSFLFTVKRGYFLEKTPVL